MLRQNTHSKSFSHTMNPAILLFKSVPSCYFTITYKLSDTEVILLPAFFSGVQSKTTVVLGTFFFSNMGEIHNISEMSCHSKSKLMNDKDSSLYLNSTNQRVIIGISRCAL